MQVKPAWRCLAITASILPLLMASPALAQDAPAGAPRDAQAGAPEEEGVIVTGTRIARRDFTGTSPITTVQAEALADTGYVNLERSLAELPQFNGTLSTAGGNLPSQTSGSVATLDLRGLGSFRNLILLDGRRLPGASTDGSVDVSTIPAGVLGSVEVITGGASAVYGSDAISGAINLKTRRNLEGTEVRIQTGVTERGDGETLDVNITHGTDFANERARLLVSGNYTTRGTVPGSALTDISLRYINPTVATGLANLSGLNAPSQAVVDTVFAGYGIPAGTVTSPNFGFNTDGSLFGVVAGVNLRGNDRNPPQFITSPFVLEEFDSALDKVFDQERLSGFARAEFDLTGDVELYAQGLYSRAVTTGAIPPTLLFPPAIIPVTNPFIPADFAQILASRPNPTAPFAFIKNTPEFGNRLTENVNETYQGLFGARGSLEFGDINWDVYYSFGGSRLSADALNGILSARLQQLLSAPDGGASICAGGYNPFGLGTPADVSSECLSFLQTTTHSETLTSQDIVEANISGNLFELPAGTIQYSLTGTYREDSLKYSPDPVVNTGGVLFIFPSPALPTQTISVSEVAGEILLPILSDLPLVESLNLTLGARSSDYNLSGSVFSYKAEADWRPFSSLMLRGGYNRAVRVPNFAELLQPATLVPIGVGGGTGGPGDPCGAAYAGNGAGTQQLRDLCIATGVPASAYGTAVFTAEVFGTAGGNPDLEPEEADTYTFGAVLSPETGNALWDGLSLSVDYYNIDIQGVISTVAGSNIWLGCYNANAGVNPNYDPNSAFCQAITRNANGEVINIETGPLNLGALRTSGVDLQAAWTFEIWNDAQLTLSSSINYLLSYETQSLPGFPFTDFAGYFGDNIGHSLFSPSPHPRWRSVSRATYSTDSYDIAVAWNHTDSMPDVSHITRPSFVLPDTESNDVFDLFGSYRFGEDYQVTLGVNNIFDTNPPASAGQAGYTAFSRYDFLGRRYSIALQARF